MWELAFVPLNVLGLVFVNGKAPGIRSEILTKSSTSPLLADHSGNSPYVSRVIAAVPPEWGRSKSLSVHPARHQGLATAGSMVTALGCMG